MSPTYFGLVELILVFGVVFAFGFWQLASLRRIAKRKPAPEAEKGEAKPR